MWHCSALSLLPRGAGAGGATLPARGTGAAGGAPHPAQHCRNGAGLLFCSFFGLIRDGCEKGSLEARGKQNSSPGLCAQTSRSHQH